MDITNRKKIKCVDVWNVGFEGKMRATVMEYLGMGAHGVTTLLLKVRLIRARCMRSAQLRIIYLFHLLIYIFYHYHYKEKYSFDFLC